MASLSSGPAIESKRRKPFLVEQRPLMLKDFLSEDFNSCSSSGFQSFPRRSCFTTVGNLLEMDRKSRASNQRRRLFRRRSKSASTTISALHKASEAVLTAIKYFPFSPTKSPSPPQNNRPKLGILPRSLSRRLRGSFWKKNDKEDHEIKVTTRVKDIVRWRSFRDLIEEKPKPLDFSSSLRSRSTTTTTNTTTTTSSRTTSNSSSWSDSDFTSDYLQSSSVSSEYSGENEGEEGKRCSSEPDEEKLSNKASELSVETNAYALQTNKSESPYREKEQFSPVSVLNFPYEEDEETENSSFHQSLPDIESTSLNRAKQKKKQKIIQRHGNPISRLGPVNLEKRIALSELDDWIECLRGSSSISIQDDTTSPKIQVDEEAIKAEERAMELLNHIKATGLLQNRKENMGHILVDFFRDGVTGMNQVEEGSNEVNYYKLLKVARDWVDGKHYELGWGFENDRAACFRDDMESGGRWSKFWEEQGELALEMEIRVWGSLVDELLLDLLS
ncbi:PREDICTED: uncharacterized protein LOC104596185 isoform X2 [Nelumbo nucifera]|uniref:Uncharacterized protein LOC104596185 isoform X2 n=1 Tax=Nelumbo nucifera TaxID=4432 RepID=A0A1U8A2Y8_NELNU|nr:PREDICTED: uncharacterized protein LOC104596185 isoform X2 [Nelumbo nucifera]